MRAPTAFALLLALTPLRAQDPGLRDAFLQAKALWATQGDREGATARLEAVVADLAPRGAGLEPTWKVILCEAYNWLAVLDDRAPQTRARAAARLQALIDLDPDFEVDRVVTSQRLGALFDRMKAETYAPVRLTFDPPDGQFTVDGRPAAPAARKFLPFGPHVLAYRRAGHAPREVQVDLSPQAGATVDFSLARTASTVAFHVHPRDAEVRLDGRLLGRAAGRAGPEFPARDQDPGDYSAAFLLEDLPPGRHTLELSAPCHRPRTFNLGPELTTPPADHLLEPLRLEDARATLAVTSPWPGGELFLGGRDLGPLPQAALSLCPGPHEVEVRFPGGGFARSLALEDAQSLTLVAEPRPRLGVLGLEPGDFPGRARFQALLEGLGGRLKSLEVRLARPGETPAQALARLKAAREVEVVLSARPVVEDGVAQVEFTLATLDGAAESLRARPLEQDPLAPLAARLDARPVVQEPGLGLALLDVPGQPGPWVLAAPEAAVQAGLRVGQPILQADGTPVATTAALRQVLARGGGTATLVQGGPAFTLPVVLETLEVPLGAPTVCQPALLAHLRLLAAGARGEEAQRVRLNLALMLMQLRSYDRAVEVLRETRLAATRGVGQGSVDYHLGVCFLHLGPAYRTEAAQAFRQALSYPHCTLLGPDGPLVAPLARQALDDLK